MKKVEHIGIAVQDIEKSGEVFRKLLGTSHYKDEVVETEFVKTRFFRLGPNKIELVQSTDPSGPIAQYLSKNREGTHHIALAVDDIVSEMERLKTEGFILLNDTPKKGADNKLICFLHPKSTNGVLVELCQDISYNDE